MLPEWRSIEPYISYGCLILLLIFPAIYGIPLIGFLVQIGAVFSAIYFSFRRMDLHLAVGVIGSLAMGSFIFGFSLLLLSVWASVVIPGAALGRFLTAGVTPSRAFAVTILFSVAVWLVVYWIEKDVIAMALTKMNEAAVLFAGDLGFSENIKDNLIDNLNKMTVIMRRLFPAFMALSGVVQLFIGWAAVVLLIRAFGEFFPSFIRFYFWKMPAYCFYLTGAFILARLAGTEIIKAAADNALFFMGFFFAVFGFSVIDYFLRKIKLTFFLRLLFYICFAFLQLPGLFLAAAIGFFDSYFDFRRVRARIIG